MYFTRRLLATAALVAGIAHAEYTPTRPQQNAIEHISQVVAGSRKCDDWELNMRLVAAIQMSSDFDIHDPETFAYVDARVMFHIERIKDRPREDICAALERLYGPEGENVVNLALRAKS